MNKKLTRQDLGNWAQALDETNAPYSSKIQEENSFFVSQLNACSGEKLEEIRNSAESDYSDSQKGSKRWKHISWGSLAAGIGVNIVTGGTAGIVALVGGFAGMMYGGARSSKEDLNSNNSMHFVSQLDDVEKAIKQKSERNERLSQIESKLAASKAQNIS
ncbi:MAG: hypothetical protein HN623_05810 [Bdellovibrionales bacterium]|nr:hypothetical protein [Bdellovibrionales bacterium]